MSQHECEDHQSYGHSLEELTHNFINFITEEECQTKKDNSHYQKVPTAIIFSVIICRYIGSDDVVKLSYCIDPFVIAL